MKRTYRMEEYEVEQVLETDALIKLEQDEQPVMLTIADIRWFIDKLGRGDKISHAQAFNSMNTILRMSLRGQLK